MLDIKVLRQNPEIVKQAMQNRRSSVDVEKIIELDKRNRHVLQELEAARAAQNRQSKGPKSPEEIELLKGLKERAKILEEEQRAVEAEFQQEFSQLPNIPLEDTPIGEGEADNIVIREVGTKPTFRFEPKSYLDIAMSMGIIDMEAAGVVSGSRFGYLKGGAALLEFALIQMVISRLTDESWIKKLIKKHKLDVPVAAFVPVVPPVMVRPEMMKAMGYMDRHADEIYQLKDDPLMLTGTSEQSIGPMHFGKVFNATDLPLRYIGFSTCFRRESGSYGKDTKGILRVHQFDKLEMFVVAHPGSSATEHRLLLAVEEALMEELGIPYRVLRLCTGDIGAPSAGTYDIEAWLPGQNEYRETHSCSNTTDYQARRLNTRFKGAEGNELVHMLNGTAFAIGRTIIAIIENFQTEKETVMVPKCLRPFMGGLKEIVSCYRSISKASKSG